MALKYDIAQVCRVGARRSNQDRIGSEASDEALLLVVADGMGGHPRGELAAQLAVDQLIDDFRREAQPRIARPEEFLLDAFSRAHHRIVVRANALEMPESPRTVLVACLLQDATATWLHVGDVRFYLLRNGKTVLRSRDHSYVQYLLDMGHIREQDLLIHPDRNLVTRSIGGDLPPQLPHPSGLALEPDDIVLLCSDGFWSPLEDAELEAGLRGAALQDEVDTLVGLAEARAGAQCDNVSVLAVVWNARERSAVRRGRPGADAPAQI